jgi:hypothetical protein
MIWKSLHHSKKWVNPVQGQKWLLELGRCSRSEEKARGINNTHFKVNCYNADSGIHSYICSCWE